MDKFQLYDFLNDNRINYEVTEHSPVYTIEDMLNIGLPYPELIAKNLFVRDDKKKNYYLITVREGLKINLKEFQLKYRTRKLSFASEGDLTTILGVKKGAVSPFGLLNDNEKKVLFFIDNSFKNNLIGVHPNDNTATVWIKYEDLLRIIYNHGNVITEI